jgi:2-oxoglutarate ferredoxin oxidoreductase subunit alpha
MIRVRARKVAGIAREIPPTEVFGPPEGDLLILGWGGTFGSLREASRRLGADGHAVAHVHLRHLNPFPPDLGRILQCYRRVLVPEINLGQLVRLIRAEYLVDAIGFNKIQGRPFKVSELMERCHKLLAGEEGDPST